MAVVPGEAGLGKSALVTEFARRCGSRAWVLWGGCDQAGHSPSAGSAARHRSAGRRCPRRTAEPRCRAREDLHRVPGCAVRTSPARAAGDRGGRRALGRRGTLDWLAFLGRRMERLSGLLIVTYRDDEVGPEHPLRRVLAALPSSIVHRVPLAAMSHACVLEQARRAGRDGELVYRLGGGNPLLVTELIKADEPAVPGAVQDLILDRIQALPAPARDLAPPGSGGAHPRGCTTRVRCPESGRCMYRRGGTGAGRRWRVIPARGASQCGGRITDPGTPGGAAPAGAAGPRCGGGSRPQSAGSPRPFAGDTDAVLRYGQVAGAAAAGQGAHREAAGHYRARGLR